MKRILNLGAGVQSTVLYLRSCLGELPQLDCAIFADTRWERAATYRHLEWLETQATKYGIPIHRVTAGNLREEMVNWQDRRARRARMPLYLLNPDGTKGILRRQCTSQFKVHPIERFIKTEILGLKPNGRWPTDAVVQLWFGISVDEHRRCAMPVRRNTLEVVIGTDLFGQSVIEDKEVLVPISWRTNLYPLCDAEFVGTERRPAGLGLMSRDGCLLWLDTHGFPRPPRSACIGCPFHSDAEWQSIKDDPLEWADACAFDAVIRGYDNSNSSQGWNGIRAKCFLHPDRMPLERVTFTTNDYPMFQCGDGICGV